MAIKTRSNPRVTNGDWSGTSAGSGGSAARATSTTKRAVGAAGLVVIGILAILDGAWGGIVPYIGPTFGYSSNGIGSFQWTLMHALLYLVPGAVAVFAGFCLLALRGSSSALFGLLLALCGAWFIIGIIAWPVLYPGLGVFTSAPAGTNFVNILGYNVGPGIVLAVLGGMALGPGRRG